MDPDIVKQLNNGVAAGVQSAIDFSRSLSQVMANMNAQLVASSDFDRRLMNGFLADQLFQQDLIQAKSAYHTPVEPAASPLPSVPAK